ASFIEQSNETLKLEKKKSKAKLEKLSAETSSVQTEYQEKLAALEREKQRHADELETAMK
ncbi:unnamed protein product, partial [Heterosigma akashiwo]